MYKWMKELKEKLQKGLSEKGQGMVEYGIVLAVVATIAGVVLWSGSTEDGKEQSLKGSVANAYQTATNKINAAQDGNINSDGTVKE